MKIKKLYGENIYSFDSFSIDFMDYSGLTSIILGKNLDDKTANGAGKTSILKTLFWALWNKELNGANIDEMVNRTNPSKGMLTILEFEDRGYEYKITRYKNYKNSECEFKLHDGSSISGSGVELLVNGDPLMGESHSKTQLIIEQKLRMSPKLFLSCVLMAQNTRESFLTANDSDKKELLSELLDLQAYDKAFKSVKDSIKEIEDKITFNENRIESLNEQISSNKNQINTLFDEEIKYFEEVAIKEKNILETIKQAEETVTSLKTLANKEPQGQGIKKEIEDILLKVNEIKKELLGETTLIQALATLDSNNQNLQNKIDESKINLEIKNNKIKELSSLIKEINEVELLSQKSLKEKELTDFSIVIKKLSSKISEEKMILKSISDSEKQSLIFHNEINEILKHIKELQENTLCPTCKRIFNEGENSSLDNIISSYKEKQNKIELKEKDNKDNLNKLQLEIIEIESIKKDFIEKEKQLELLNHELNLIKEEEQKINLVKNQNSLYLKQIEDLKSEQNELNIIIEKTQNKLKFDMGKKIQVAALLADLDPKKEQLIELENIIQRKRKEIESFEEENLKIHQAKLELNAKTNQIVSLKKEVSDLKSKQNPYSVMKETLIKQTEALDERLSKHKESITEQQDELKYLNFWKIGFAPVGIRSFITDDVIELLNRKTQENLNDLFDGAISVMFDPESKNNKGIVSNKISTIYLHNGKPTSFALLSGGEQQRAILATELALTEVAEARAGTKLNLRFLDEPFNGIDANGQIKSLILFARLAREKDGFFVISHDENFQHLCQKAVFVLKNKEVSKIVDKRTFDNSDIGGEKSEKEDTIIKKESKTFDLDKALKKKKELLDEDE